MASPARLALALLAVLVAAPAVLATFTTVTGYVYCDVDKSNSVDIPPDTPAKGAQVKIVCIVAPPNNTSTKYAFADADGMYTFNMTIPTFNSTRGLFGGCIASLVNQPNTTCAKPGPCNGGDVGTTVQNGTGGSILYYGTDYSLPPFCFEPTPKSPPPPKSPPLPPISSPPPPVSSPPLIPL
eukprot:SM004152S15590  [mRNA]  locus=s4152:123:1288:+ [translate_table: standard]